MANIQQEPSFLAFKRSFFNEEVTKKNARVVAEDFKNTYDHAWLLKEKTNLENEFKQLYAVLSQDAECREEYFCFCLITAVLLEKHYHRRYKDKAKQYRKHIKTLETFIDNDGVLPEKDEKRDAFYLRFLLTVRDDLAAIISTPLHISKIRDVISTLNGWRIYWSMFRPMVSTTLTLIQNTEYLRNIFHFVDIDNTLRILEATKPVTNVLSVTWFGLRLLSHLAEMANILIFSKDKKDNAAFFAELKRELWDRKASFINDSMWFIVNFITNYAPLLHISPLWSSIITLVFLFADTLVIWLVRTSDKRDYLAKKAQYRAELRLTDDPERKRVLQAQIDELEIAWKALNAKHFFTLGAAAMLILGFGAAIVLTTFGLSVVAFTACVLGSAMYMSQDKFQAYFEAKKRLEQAMLDGLPTKELRRACRKAAIDFALTLAEYAIVPAILMGAWILCWQLGLSLTLTYITYKVLNAVITQAMARPNEEKKEKNSVLTKKGLFEEKPLNEMPSLYESEKEERHGFLDCCA